jgi:hypothetical protein
MRPAVIIFAFTFLLFAFSGYANANVNYDGTNTGPIDFANLGTLGIGANTVAGRFIAAGSYSTTENPNDGFIVTLPKGLSIQVEFDLSNLVTELSGVGTTVNTVFGVDVYRVDPNNPGFVIPPADIQKVIQSNGSISFTYAARTSTVGLDFLTIPRLSTIPYEDSIKAMVVVITFIV